MKRIAALKAKIRFGELPEAAQRRQCMAGERLRRSPQRAAEHSAPQGMNENVLDQLLADES